MMKKSRSLLLLLLGRAVVAAAAASEVAAGVAGVVGVAAAAAVLHMLLRSTLGCSLRAVLRWLLMLQRCARHWKTEQVRIGMRESTYMCHTVVVQGVTEGVVKGVTERVMQKVMRGLHRTDLHQKTQHTWVQPAGCATLC
jgi:hypothetical protein